MAEQNKVKALFGEAVKRNQARIEREAEEKARAEESKAPGKPVPRWKPYPNETPEEAMWYEKFPQSKKLEYFQRGTIPPRGNATWVAVDEVWGRHLPYEECTKVNRVGHVLTSRTGTLPPTKWTIASARSQP